MDDWLINKYEREMNIDFDPLSLKNIINERMTQFNVLNLERTNKFYKVWSNIDGLPERPDIPLIHSEVYFPFIRDPRVVL